LLRGAGGSALPEKSAVSGSAEPCVAIGSFVLAGDSSNVGNAASNPAA